MKTNTSIRFRDDRICIQEFADEFLVVCPRCVRCAHVVARGEAEKMTFGPHRIFCPSCAYSKDKGVQGYSPSPHRDWFFGCPLWLSVPCAGKQLSAFNYRHLAWLERYVAATLRETNRHPESGWSNVSAANRLPQWIKSAKNRRTILRGIAKIKRDSLAR